MKKTIAIALAACLCVLLCACAGDVELPPLPSLQPETAAEPSAEPGEAAAPAESEAPPSIPLPAQVLIKIKTTTLEQYDPAEGKDLILTFSYDTPTVHIEDRDAASQAINEALAMINESFYTGNDYGSPLGDDVPSGFLGMLEAAEDNYAYASSIDYEISTEYSCTSTARIERADEKIISFVLTYYSFTGGVHGNYVDRAHNYSAETGEELTLDRLSNDPDAFRAKVLESMLEQVKSGEVRVEESFLIDESLEEALTKLLRDGSWTFDAKGLVVFSDLYELAPYTSGILSFHIPYEQMNGLLDASWLPAERTGEGELRVVNLEDFSGNGMPIVDRVVVEESGASEYCLIADGPVYDLSICSAYYADGVKMFFEHAQLWRCSYLKDAAVQISTAVPDGLPNLMIRYRGADGLSHIRLLSQSGEDGHAILVDDTVEAVG